MYMEIYTEHYKDTFIPWNSRLVGATMYMALTGLSNEPGGVDIAYSNNNTGYVRFTSGASELARMTASNMLVAGNIATSSNVTTCNLCVTGGIYTDTAMQHPYIGSQWSNVVGGSGIAITSSNVGIGTSNPQYMLDVRGTSYSSNAFAYAMSVSNLTVSNLNVIGLQNTITTNVQVTDQFSVSNLGTGPAMIVHQLGAADIAEFWDDQAIALKLNQGGKVSMGATSATELLDVYGNAKFNSNVYIMQKLGINNSNPQKQLDVTGSINVSSNMTTCNICVTGGIYTDTAFTKQYIGSQWSNVVGGSGIALLNSNVGIGLSNPNALYNLDVNSNIHSSYLTIDSNLTTSNLTCTGTTNISGTLAFNNMIQFQSFRVNASTAGNPVNFISSVVGFSNEVNGIDITTQCNYVRFSGSNSAEWARFSNCNLTVANNVGFSNTLTGPYIVASNVTASNVTALSIISSTHTTSNMTVSSNITVPYITASNVVASNVNFTGSLLQNGVAYVGSQWSGVSGGTISYNTGLVNVNAFQAGGMNATSLATTSFITCGTTMTTCNLTASSSISCSGIINSIMYYCCVPMTTNNATGYLTFTSTGTTLWPSSWSSGGLTHGSGGSSYYAWQPPVSGLWSLYYVNSFSYGSAFQIILIKNASNPGGANYAWPGFVSDTSSSPNALAALCVNTGSPRFTLNCVNYLTTTDTISLATDVTATGITGGFFRAALIQEIV